MTNKRPQAADAKPQMSKQPVKTPKPPKVDLDQSEEELEKASGGGRGQPVSGLV